MKDLAVALDNRPGALAEMGEALGKAGVSVEGGGAWVTQQSVDPGRRRHGKGTRRFAGMGE